MTMMTNNNDSGVCDDDYYGNDGDGVRHRPPFAGDFTAPRLVGRGVGARVGS